MIYGYAFSGVEVRHEPSGVRAHQTLRKSKKPKQTDRTAVMRVCNLFYAEAREVAPSTFSFYFSSYFVMMHTLGSLKIGLRSCVRRVQVLAKPFCPIFPGPDGRGEISFPVSIGHWLRLLPGLRLRDLTLIWSGLDQDSLLYLNFPTVQATYLVGNDGWSKASLYLPHGPFKKKPSL